MRNLSLSRKHSWGIVATAGLALSLSTAVAAPPETISGTYGTVVIGDLPGMLDRGAELGKSVSPGISGDVIRGQLGMLLGDEGLKSVPAGSGLVVVIPSSARPFLLIETAEGKAEDIANLIKQRLTNSSTKALNDKLVAVGMDQASIDNASGAMGTSAAELLNNNDDKFVVATIDADTVIKEKGPQLQNMLKQIASKTHGTDDSSSATANGIAFLGQLVNATAKRTDVASIKIDISGDGVLFEKTLWPIGGVNLQDPEGPTGQELLKSLPASENAMMRYDYYLDTQSAYQALKPIISEAMSGVGVSSSDQAEMMKVTDLAGEAFGDGIAGWIRAGEDGAHGTYVLTVNDKEKALQYIEEAASAMSTGSLSHLYKSIGMETSGSLVRNAETIDGQPAHRFSMKMDATGAMANSPMVSMYNMTDALITFVDNNKMLMLIGDVPAEETVAAVKSGSGAGTELKSRSELPPNGAFYLDYDMGAMMDSVATKDPQVAKFADTFEGVSILEAGYVTDESLRFMMLIPGDAIKKMVTGFQNMARQNTGQSAPEGTVPRTPARADETTTDVEESVQNVQDDVTTTTP